MSMKVAVRLLKHSPRLGQLALSQTVFRRERAQQALDLVVVVAALALHAQPVRLAASAGRAPVRRARIAAERRSPDVARAVAHDAAPPTGRARPPA